MPPQPPPARSPPPPQPPPSTEAVTGRRRFVQDNALALGATVVGGILGFLLQAITSHALRPGDYGRAFAVVSFFTLVTRPSAAFARLVAWQTSREISARGGGAERSSVLRRVIVALLVAGSVGGILCIAGSSALGAYLHVPVRYVVVSAVSIPFLLAVQPLLGGLQGERRFVPWSFLSVLVILSTFVCVVGLVFALGVFGVLLGTTLASIMTFAICLGAVWTEFTTYKGVFEWRPVIPFIATGLVSTLAVGVFLGVDVVIVEHFFAKAVGGEYAAVAVAGNAVFFVMGGVASVVFPIIAAQHAGERSTFGVMGASLGLCGAAGLVGTIGLQLFGHFILLHFAGRRYVAGAHYIGWYALGMAILGGVVILVNTLQSLNSLALLWVLIPVTLLRPALLLVFHATIMTVVVVSDLSVAVFAIILAGMYVMSERLRLRTVRLAGVGAGAGVASGDALAPTL